ncbi:MAG: metal ABC transporter ATP-binding protein [Acidimicrobiales bacterium]|nr:metal ABC transporter ATP-binding protein [Acidimicrobiales bacterium]
MPIAPDDSDAEVLAGVEGLSVAYGSLRALEDVDFTVPAGCTVAVIGPNGSGKSTLLGALAGLVAPTAGRVIADRDRIALVLQATTVDPTLPITVVETVRMARYRRRGLFGRIRGRDDEIVRAAMERTRVADLASRQLHELSGGQRQRVLVAQGLAQRADLLLLDEPATGLDVVSQQVIHDVIDEERDAGRSVVMTTHSLDDAARCDAVLLLAGRVVAFGPPSVVLTPDHLDRAFGTALVRLPGGHTLLDDPHHHDAVHHPGHHHGHHHVED